MVVKEKALDAYMSIEAALIVPLVIGIYFLLIFTAFFLFNKCTLAQDTYIKCYRASVFTYWEEGYGEVAYGMLLERSAGKAKEYIASRNDFSRYPYFTLTDEDVTALQLGVLTPEVLVRVKIRGTGQTFVARDYSLQVSATSLVRNPVGDIRIVRRNEKNVAD
ncbi:MAG: hypothetical protein LBI54_02660 [Lachnospiraceae bacterium]|jgi:hypothetical protein|nr:hypothetical protein [Lachnospiraceae bacterium]